MWKSFRALLEFAAVTLPLAWLWTRWGLDLYVEFFVHVTQPVFAALGWPALDPRGAQGRFIGFVPFLGLLWVTPGISWKRRFWGSLAGVTAIFFSHVALVAARYSAGGFIELFPAILLVIALPFLAWAVVAHGFISELAASARSPSRKAPDAESPDVDSLQR